jgi:alpha-tubulin suppressor-like RCC1 family protein
MMNTSSSIQPTPLRRRSTSSLLVMCVAALFAAIMVLLIAVERTDAQAQGEVWAWGLNGAGQLGDGTTTQRHTPVQVSGLSGVQDIAGGWQHSLAAGGDNTSPKVIGTSPKQKLPKLPLQPTSGQPSQRRWIETL